jgi:hypothetical protein
LNFPAPSATLNPKANRSPFLEIRQDRHPVVILCGRDLAAILMEKGLNSAQRVWAWLEGEFPAATA